MRTSKEDERITPIDDSNSRDPNTNPVPKARTDILKRRNKIIKKEEFENGNKERSEKRVEIKQQINDRRGAALGFNTATDGGIPMVVYIEKSNE